MHGHLARTPMELQLDESQAQMADWPQRVSNIHTPYVFPQETSPTTLANSCSLVATGFTISQLSFAEVPPAHQFCGATASSVVVPWRSGVHFRERTDPNDLVMSAMSDSVSSTLFFQVWVKIGCPNSIQQSPRISSIQQHPILHLQKYPVSASKNIHSNSFLRVSNHYMLQIHDTIIIGC